MEVALLVAALLVATSIVLIPLVFLGWIALGVAVVAALGIRKPEAAGSPIVARVEFVGSTQAHHHLVGAENLIDLLREHVGVDQISTVIAKVVVATRLAVSREQLLDRKNLQSALLRRVDSLRDEGSGLDDLLVEFDTSARMRLDELLADDPGLIDSVLERAEQILVDGLEDAS